MAWWRWLRRRFARKSAPTASTDDMRRALMMALAAGVVVPKELLAAFGFESGDGFTEVVIPRGAAGVAAEGNYFGDGTDGAVTISSNTEESVTEDTGVLVKNYSSLTIDASVSLTTDNRCKAALIYVDGDCTINGTLKMDSRGASQSAGGDVNISRSESGGAGGGTTAHADFQPSEDNQPTSDVGGGTHTKYRSQQAGGGGGPGGADQSGAGSAGTAGSTDQTGGGGGGGGGRGPGSQVGGDGAAGTAYSGGPGGGGAGGSDGSDATDASANGGSGGPGSSSSVANRGGGGGAGNPGGALGSGNAQAGTDGTGGFLVLVVSGDLTIASGGVVSADGASGGNAGTQDPSTGGGGGGSGGGRVIILYKGTLTNNGTIRANGGAGGTTLSAGTGGTGGAGTTSTVQVV